MLETRLLCLLLQHALAFLFLFFYITTVISYHYFWSPIKPTFQCLCWSTNKRIRFETAYEALLGKHLKDDSKKYEISHSSLFSLKFITWKCRSSKTFSDILYSNSFNGKHHSLLSHYNVGGLKLTDLSTITLKIWNVGTQQLQQHKKKVHL